MRNALLHHLPGRETRALHHRPRLVDPHQRDLSPLVRGADHAERSAVARRGQGPRVAVREDARARRHERGAVGPHRAVRLDVLRTNRFRLGEQARADRVQRLPRERDGAPAHAIERPEEVDGRRARRGETFDGGLEIGQQPVERGRAALPRREDDAVRGRDPDRRRAAHDERADGIGHVFPARVVALDFAQRQHRLIEEPQPTVRPADRLDRQAQKAPEYVSIRRRGRPRSVSASRRKL